MIFSFLSIFLAVFVVIFVYEKIRGADFLPSIELSSDANEEESSNIIIETETLESEIGFNKDNDGNIIYLLEDGTKAYDMWIVENKKLYYFNEEGFMQTEPYSEEAMNYKFSKSGEVVSIKYNPSYKQQSESVIQGFDNLVRNKKLWVYTDVNSQIGSFYTLMYKSTTEAMSYILGSELNPQISSPNSIQLKDDYVYFLPYSSSPLDSDRDINKKLFRIKAGEADRYLGCENVQGFKICDEYIFADSNNDIKVLTDDDFVKDDSFNTSWMNADSFKVDIESEPGKAVLMSSDGVKAVGYMSDEFFKAGNFYYKLSPEGEILDVRDKDSVSIGGYKYFVMIDDSLGANMSVFVREDSKGRVEILSSEFPGIVKNLHYDFNSKYIFAEYESGASVHRIIRISLLGDVDYLEDQGLNGGKLKLIALQDNNAVVKEEVGDLVNYYNLRTRATVPLAIAVDPVLISDNIEGPYFNESQSGDNTNNSSSSDKNNKNNNKTDKNNNKNSGKNNRDNSGKELVIEDGPGEILDNIGPDSADTVVGGRPG